MFVKKMENFCNNASKHYLYLVKNQKLFKPLPLLRKYKLKFGYLPNFCNNASKHYLYVVKNQKLFQPLPLLRKYKLKFSDLRLLLKSCSISKSGCVFIGAVLKLKIECNVLLSSHTTLASRNYPPARSHNSVNFDLNKQKTV